MKDRCEKKWLCLLCVLMLLFAAPVQISAQRILTESDAEEKGVADYTKINIAFEQGLSWKLVCNASVFYFSRDTAELNYHLQTAPLKFSPAGISTYVHEALHHFEYVCASHDVAHVCYYLDSNTVLQVPRFSEKLLPAGVLKRFVNQMLPDDFDRSYILNTTWSMAGDGIYGLLGELSAYSQNRIFLNQIYPLLDTLEYVNTERFWEHVQKEHENQVLAYYKFNTYIAQYLQIANESDEVLYNFLKDNTALKRAYTAIDRRFAEEIAHSNNVYTQKPRNGHTAIQQKHMHLREAIEQAKAAYSADDIQQTLKGFAYDDRR